ncbi:MAG TPA: hypothetical protein VFJ16_14490 [Longimicrobium sp.]|nr:hypothetical protein [Longimicrobium sp.]
MRTTRYLLATLALLAAAGCARTERITAPERAAAPRHDGVPTTPPDTTKKNGLIGSGG